MNPSESVKVRLQKIMIAFGGYFNKQNIEWLNEKSKYKDIINVDIEKEQCVLLIKLYHILKNLITHLTIKDPFAYLVLRGNQQT